MTSIWGPDHSTAAEEVKIYEVLADLIKLIQGISKWAVTSLAGSVLPSASSKSIAPMNEWMNRPSRRSPSIQVSAFFTSLCFLYSASDLATFLGFSGISSRWVCVCIFSNSTQEYSWKWVRIYLGNLGTTGKKKAKLITRRKPNNSRYGFSRRRLENCGFWVNCFTILFITRKN